MATLNEYLSMRKLQIEQQFESCKKELSYLEDQVMTKQSELAQYKGAYAEISNLIQLIANSESVDTTNEVSENSVYDE